MKKALISAAGVVVLLAGIGYTLTETRAMHHSEHMEQGQDARPAVSLIPLSAESSAAESPDQAELPFRVSQSGNHLQKFASFAEAVSYAHEFTSSFVTTNSDDRIIWSNVEELPDSASVDGVPLISQLPELERGCEVTSLDMLLGFDGIEVDKMTLADKVKKDPAPFEIIDGEIHFGNPNTGFVGNMESFEESGFGVYHGPIVELAAQYVGDRAVDLTGADFEDLLRFVAGGQPVWVIDNLRYAPLSDDEFETWHTEDGPIDITYQEHSVVITGYTPDTVLLHDPIEGEIEVDRGSFAEAWAQMGSQAIVILKKTESQKEAST